MGKKYISTIIINGRTPINDFAEKLDRITTRIRAVINPIKINPVIDRNIVHFLV
jgi:hypothetical protein